MTGYRYARVVRLTMDDPTDEGMNEGDIILQAGKEHDGVAYTVLNPDTEGFTRITCETLGTVGPSEYPMNEREIEKWATDQEKARELAGFDTEDA